MEETTGPTLRLVPGGAATDGTITGADVLREWTRMSADYLSQHASVVPLDDPLHGEIQELASKHLALCGLVVPACP